MSIHPCPVAQCVDPNDPDGNAPLITTALCGRHEHRLRVLLAELPSLYVQLDLALAHRPQSKGERTSKNEAVPLPINVEARALQEALVRALVDAERELRRVAHLVPAQRKREARLVNDASVFVARRFDELLAHDFGVELALDLFRWHQSTRRALGLTRLIHRLPAPCPSCECMGLEREDGDDRVRCRACGLVFTEDEYARLVLILSEGMIQ